MSRGKKTGARSVEKDEQSERWSDKHCEGKAKQVSAERTVQGK